MHAKGVFITGTGTDVGKTFVTALLVKKFRDSGIDAFYYKAALSGASLNPDQGPASDEQYVKTVASLPETHETLVSYVYQEAVSPHLAARKEGNPLELSKVISDYELLKSKHDFIFVEGSGGIICPIRYDSQKIFLEDIIKALDLEIIIVSNALLGSINATVLTVEYARSKGIGILGIILNQYQGSEMEQDNYKMIQEITGVSILATVPFNAKEIELNIEGF